jgi:hypothetical protein
MTEREANLGKVPELNDIEVDKKRFFFLYNKYFGGEVISKEQINEMQALAEKIHQKEKADGSLC